MTVDCQEPTTLVLSDEDHERYLDASAEERRLGEENPAYRKAWLGCLPPSRVEPYAWGPGYVCIPAGAVQ